jgi:hypothetical protein
MFDLEYYQRKLDEMQKDIVLKAVNFLKQYIKDSTKKAIINYIESYGLIEWAIKKDIHFYWGMEVRNALRSKANLHDDLLPNESWDDYYVQIIEIAVGKRDYII